MLYAVVYAENSDLVGTYDSPEEAAQSLAAFIEAHPTRQDEIGMRPYINGRPVGPWLPASEVLGDAVAQRHLSV